MFLTPNFSKTIKTNIEIVSILLSFHLYKIKLYSTYFCFKIFILSIVQIYLMRFEHLTKYMTPFANWGRLDQNLKMNNV